MRPAGPESGAVAHQRPGSYGFALTIDVEEWYHTCLVPELVDPSRRPVVEEEIDWLLPELLDLVEASGRRATFFVLGEVAERWPARVREITDRGHEVGSHGHLHLRWVDRPAESVRRDLHRSKSTLEQIVGRPVNAFRAPEWSLRWLGNPQLEIVAELGFEVDSSLAPYPGAGRRSNPLAISTVAWPSGRSLLEAPPLVTNRWLRLPAAGWPARLRGADHVVRAARASLDRGELPVYVVHPWEVSDRPTPGRLTGLARFVHETGRRGFRSIFVELLNALPWQPLNEALAVTEPVEPSAEGELDHDGLAAGARPVAAGVAP